MADNVDTIGLPLGRNFRCRSRQDEARAPPGLPTVRIQFTGQVERDSAGVLWAVLYRIDGDRTQQISNERVRTVRHGKRRVADLVLAAYDNSQLARNSLPRRNGGDLQDK